MEAVNYMRVKSVLAGLEADFSYEQFSSKENVRWVKTCHKKFSVHSHA